MTSILIQVAWIVAAFCGAMLFADPLVHFLCLFNVGMWAFIVGVESWALWGQR